MSDHALHCLARKGSTGLISALLVGLAHAGPAAVRPTFDASTLPAVATPADVNPYRAREDKAAIIETGRSVYNQSCATCHGVDATRFGPAPPLRLVGRLCLRIKDATLHARCMSDADHYFYQSVQEGKVRLGVTHMPSWRNVLPPEAIWAVRTFLESAPPAGSAPAAHSATMP